MPLSGPSSYLSTTDEFLAHWALMNTQLGASGSMLLTVGPANAPETFSIAQLGALRSDFNAAQDEIQSILNTVEIKRGQLALDKRILLDDAQSFGRKLRALFPGASPFVGALPDLPILSAGADTFSKPMRDLRDIWRKVVAAGITVLLPSGRTLLAFEASVVALDLNWQLLNTAEVNLRFEREKRNALQSRLESVLGRYRPTVESLLMPESPLVLTIPRLRPGAGHTPDPVALTAVWDAALGKARLNWAASADADLASYQVRMSPTADYNADAESILATLTPSPAREFLTTAGLATAGATASYKIYVILKTGNEAGSTAVALTRP